MPQIINAYNEANNSIAQSLRDLGQGMFGDEGKKEINAQTAAKLREEVAKAQRENQGVGSLAEAFRRGDTNAMGVAGILAGKDPKYTGGYNLYYQGNNRPIDDPRVSGAAIGAGEAMANTPLGQTRSLQNQRDIKQLELDQPGFGVVGEEPFGGKQYGFVNKQTQTVNPIALGGAGQFDTKVDPNLHGEEYLTAAGVDPRVADTIRAVSEGRQELPKGRALSAPLWGQVLKHIYQYDPEADAVTLPARSSVRKDFTSGKSANSINALNTLAGHIGTLETTGNLLDNTSYPAVNWATNIWRNQVGDERVKNFNAAKKAVVDELVRSWRGVGGTEGDIQTWSNEISAANSPEQLHGVLGTISHLIQSRLGALGTQYTQGMGHKAQPPIPIVTPETQAVFDRLTSAQRAAPPQPQQPAGKVQGRMPQGLPGLVGTPAEHAATAQPPPGFRQAPDGRFLSEKPGPNGKYQEWTP